MTQGIVTIRKDNRVVMKIVAGCDGYRAPKLASVLRAAVATKFPSLEEAYMLAEIVGFGSRECLVVMGLNRTLFQGDEDLHSRYRDTFDQPRFNPRWECGIVDDDCFEIVDL